MKSTLSDELISYVGQLTVTQGRLSGQPFDVLPWQRRFVRGAFAPGIQSAALSVARGNGKTALLSGIAAATLDGPLMVPRGETVIVASSFEQAGLPSSMSSPSWAPSWPTSAPGKSGTLLNKPESSTV